MYWLQCGMYNQSVNEYSPDPCVVWTACAIRSSMYAGSLYCKYVSDLEILTLMGKLWTVALLPGSCAQVTKLLSTDASDVEASLIQFDEMMTIWASLPLLFLGKMGNLLLYARNANVTGDT